MASERPEASHPRPFILALWFACPGFSFLRGISLKDSRSHSTDTRLDAQPLFAVVAIVAQATPPRILRFASPPLGFAPFAQPCHHVLGVGQQTPPVAARPVQPEHLHCCCAATLAAKGAALLIALLTCTSAPVYRPSFQVTPLVCHTPRPT